MSNGERKGEREREEKHESNKAKEEMYATMILCSTS
jgi:hypothetical protein